MTRATGNPRGRPPLNPMLKFMEEIQFWEVANRYQGARVDMPTRGKAIEWRHRLHRCRAAIRNLDGNGFVVWDNYTIPEPVEFGGKWWVYIRLRSKVDLSGITDLNGNPISLPDPDKAVLQNATQTYRELITAKPIPAYDPITQRQQPYAPPDLTKPLIDC